jgi:hypothetical protein
MGENLRAIQFADGRKLKHIGNSSEWKKLDYSDKACCY